MINNNNDNNSLSCISFTNYTTSSFNFKGSHPRSRITAGEGFLLYEIAILVLSKQTCIMFHSMSMHVLRLISVFLPHHCSLSSDGDSLQHHFQPFQDQNFCFCYVLPTVLLRR